MDKKVVLKVNGKEISLNSFVTEVFFNVVDGLVESLDKVPEDRETIEIRIERGKKS